MDFEKELLERVQGIQAFQAAHPQHPGHEPTIEIETNDLDHEKASLGPVLLDRGVTAVNIFHHREAHPYVLDFALIQKYGSEWMDWEPETLEIHILEDFRGGLSEINMSKIQAMKTLHMVDTFWKQWEVFNWCLCSINGVMPDFEVLHVPTAAQCSVAVDVASRVREDVPWSDEVKTFLSVVFSHDGVFCPQSPCEFVHVDLEGLPINAEEVNRRWPDVRASGKAPGGDTVVDEQLRRLLVVNEYLEENRSRLHRQMLLVHHAGH